VDSFDAERWQHHIVYDDGDKLAEALEPGPHDEPLCKWEILDADGKGRPKPRPRVDGVNSGGGGSEEEVRTALSALEPLVRCAACKFVMGEPVTTPSGHSFCKCCFDELSKADSSGTDSSGRLLAPFIAEDRVRRTVCSLRSSIKVNAKLSHVISSLFPSELARLRPAVRLRAYRNARDGVTEPLDGRRRAKLGRVARPKEPAKSWEELQAEKKAKEEARVADMIAQGKDVFSGDRDNKNMPDISHLRDAKGKPLVHNRSCHVCTQGNASWRGGFFQPIGCSKCNLIFCPRCLGHIMKRPYSKDSPEDKAFIENFIEQNWDKWTCVCCEGKCACQDVRFEAAKIVSCSAGKGGGVFTVDKEHPFIEGDKVRISGHEHPGDKESKLKGGEWAVASVVGPRSFTLDAAQLAKAAINLEAAGKGGKGGAVELVKLQKHKKYGWAGSTGVGVSKQAAPGQKLKPAGKAGGKEPAKVRGTAAGTAAGKAGGKAAGKAANGAASGAESGASSASAGAGSKRKADAAPAKGKKAKA